MFSSFKFAATFPLVIIQFDFSFFECILWTNVGGIIGICFFAFLSERLIAWWKRIFRRSNRPILEDEQQVKKKFTKRNRRIVRVKQKYGLIGIAMITPFLLSIPVGVFLVVRYYHTSKSRFLYLIAANFIWSVIYTAFYMFWEELLIKRS
ncbi:MAG: hypothetical protein DRI98_03075 [Bacteroidetes bacterium]|nr:MAG: hypothetical protein DRI98_03075 [Bacteroidota bacterium]